MTNLNNEMCDADLDHVSGGFDISLCAGDACLTLSIGSKSPENPPVGTQVYNAVMAGMHSVTHA